MSFTSHDIHSFLGCSHWLVQHYPWLNTDTLAIRKALVKGVVQWSSAATKTIRTIKDMIVCLPPLKLPSDNTVLVVYTDASQFAWGGVLAEVGAPDANDHTSPDNKIICRFASGSF